MLTIRTSAHVPTNHHRGSCRCSPASTGAPLARVGSSRALQAWIRLADAEARRLWLESQWRSHLQKVRSRRKRGRP